MWQALADEFAACDVDVTLVALDTPAAAAPWMEPVDGVRCLIDEALLTVDAFGWTNVPAAVLYDEAGHIVRGPDIAFIKPKRSMPLPDGAPPEQRQMIEFINAFPNSAEAWLAGVRDWVAKGSSSSFALSPEEVASRSREHGFDAAQAAAHYALAEHLRRSGHEGAARTHYAEAHALDPEQFNRKRQAWSIGGGPEKFGTSFLDQMQRHGPEAFYPPVYLDQIGE